MGKRKGWKEEGWKNEKGIIIIIGKEEGVEWFYMRVAWSHHKFPRQRHSVEEKKSRHPRHLGFNKYILYV